MIKRTKPLVKIKYLVLIVILAFTYNCKNKETQNKIESNNLDIVTKVVVQKVAIGSSSNKLTYNGNIIPVKTTPLSFLLPGTVTTIKVNEGDRVKNGQVLAQINSTSYQNAYQATKATLYQAEDAYNRLKTVHDKGSLPEIKWEDVKSKLEQAKSANQIAFQNLVNTSLKAPTNGIIGMRKLEIGETTTPGVTVLKIVNISEVYVKVSVPENEINKIKKGQIASIIIPALGSHLYNGMVEKIGVLANTISKTYDVKIKVANKKGVIKPGMACDVTIKTNPKSDIITIPYQSILKDNDGQNYVFVVNPNTNIASKQEVQLGSFANNRIEIISGISKGDLIIVEGKQKITNKQKVTFN